MRLTVRKIEDVAVLTLSGKLGDMETAASLHMKVKGLIRSGIKKFVFNMHEIDGITSGGLGILMACQTSVVNGEGQIKLVKINKAVQQFFSITNLDTYFDIYESEEESLKNFN